MTDTESLKQLALMGGINAPIKVSSHEFSEKLRSSPQTASRRLQELDEAGYISRTIQGNGQWMTITDLGVELLRNEYYAYQKIFEGNEDAIELIGTVMTGLGEGQYYIAQDGYMKQFSEKLGFQPFPGTLNLNLTKESTTLRKKLDNRKGIPISGFKAENRTFGGGRCFLGEIKGIKSAVIIPDRTHYPEDIVEILAPVNLRKSLSVKDGDEIRMKVFI
ncbi:riboflavin kinase [Methanosarcinales archaeon]|uniref:Riboflavin kinase n=1 Tax=Candidatus Syntropharchaeum caldarium TaxID=1838285 RepID=A0A1F2P8S6_9EURY|nr:MAG: transcriptional regulator of a riboflavin/FAD biosynthetic operon [Candidatus Syntrophoarchaeum caldarius]RLG32933.1 MAG: riboflavin kinase [Methanosarcinales archaeon]